MSSLVSTVKSKLSDFAVYWKKPPKGRYMPFREIASYSFGGIGAYCIITLGTACLISTGNVLITSTLGVSPVDSYVMYLIAVLANIPMTGIRANIIDNTRNKAGKYRPYIVTMAIPTAICTLLMVYFPYSWLNAKLVGEMVLFNKTYTYGYLAKCAVIMALNLVLHFCYYFFYDAYENLIHVLSPDSQERADVTSIKSVVYSFAPTLVNLFTPLIAQNIFHTNATDIRVYRLLYPILTVFGIILCIVVYKGTEEKIVQAKTHVVQVKFTDALREVAKNKYFWIISLAGWIGFLESAYANIMYWLYNYGGACNGNVYGVIVTIYGNASLWGMLLAPFMIRKWGKKAVLVVTNLFNILFILLMLPCLKVGYQNGQVLPISIWLVLICLYMNAFMGSFAHILNPAIQADIRDYQQYVSGERIDGMFSAVATIGTVITLATSAVLPKIYEMKGLTAENAAKVTSNPGVLSRMIGDQSVGELLAQQLEQGQDNYTNAFSALYDPDILISLLKVLIIFSAIGAFANVVPYFWYDFNETKQKSVVRALKIRAMFEDYGNNSLKDEDLVETCDIISAAKELCGEEPVAVSKSMYKSIKDKAERKAAKNDYKALVKRNEEIEISKFVMDEFNKFETEMYKERLAAGQSVIAAGLEDIANYRLSTVKADLAAAKALPKNTQEEKDYRKASIEIARAKVTAQKTYQKYYADGQEAFAEPDFAVLESYYDEEDYCDNEIKRINSLPDAKAHRAEVEQLVAKRKVARTKAKEEVERHARFNNAARPYLNAVKLLKEKENHDNFDAIVAQYDDAKARIAKKERIADEQAKAEAAQKKADKEARKAAKAKK